eukprot:m51a1_g847 putative WASH complex (1158) ;mRNA; f:778413-782661
MDFLAEGNVAGQSLLRLVSRANAIIAELMRLSQNVPRLFEEVPDEYQNIIFDFRYLKNQDLYETRIEDSSELLELDGALKESHHEILKRFYNVFESIVKYHADLTRYLADLDDGVFIQLTLEAVLDSPDGRQLLCEALYLWCVMLTLLDTLVDGAVRERLVVAFVRRRARAELAMADDVIKLCRASGYTRAAGKKPQGYPEEYLARFPLPSTAVSLVIGRLRSDDIYNQIRAYPMPEHRSTALATQAAMLYMILYLAPNILQKENAVMREIVDKHFPDNWVIAYYMGFTVDISVAWEGYKAAKLAIANTVQQSNVAGVATRYWGSVAGIQRELRGYLTEGVLTEEYILDTMPKLLVCDRNSNVTLRWLLLHVMSQNKKIRETVLGASSALEGEEKGSHVEAILMLLLNTAQYEFELKKITQSILDSKDARWDEYRKEAVGRMNELGEYFSGEKALTRVKANKHLEKWFHDIASQIGGLDYSDRTVAGRKMQQLKQALEEVEQFHDIEQNLQVRQFLVDTRKFLEQMIRIVNIAPGVLSMLDIVSDLSYAWDILRVPELYIPALQARIKAEPALVLKLRSTLVKLSSILNLPLVRINQANSPDLLSVSAYYSDELVSYVRRVLEVIPRSVFEILHRIIELQTKSIPVLPTKLEKDQVRDVVQLEDRFRLAEATHAISVFTEGILAMETTLVGIDKVIPKKLLEDGIRKELVFRLSIALDRTLTFHSGKLDELLQRVAHVGTILDGYCRSFQYIQDYIRMQGLRIWQEEFMRIINFNVEQECSAFLTKKPEFQSRYQSKEVEIPVFPRTDAMSVNFIGRLARALLAHTDNQNTTYIEAMGAWYDPSTGVELIGQPTFSSLLNGISVFGATGLDQLYAFMAVKELQVLVKFMHAQIDGDKATAKFVSDLGAELEPKTTIPRETAKIYETALQQMKRIAPQLVASVSRVGQIQLLRRQLQRTLNVKCKAESNLLNCTLDVLNQSLLKDVRAHYIDPQNLPYPDPENPLLPELAKYIDTAGLTDPTSKIYVTTTALQSLPLVVFVVVLSVLPKYCYNSKLGLMVAKADKGKQRNDAAALVVGIITLLRQFHVQNIPSFVGYCAQYVRGFLNLMQVSKGETEFPAEVNSMLLFLETFVKYGGYSRNLVDACLPPFLFDNFKHV